ncbi:DNA/RNA nuclease SfsA [Nereida sp.]|uniref:DNA/RNA nuclease SfsA n=1 Tax=Nereida sp. TaxID=2736090 RepID=UPI003F6A3030
MRFQTQLIPATLIRRYNRFLSDMRLENGEVVRAHCPNPGAMTGLKDEGAICWLEPNDETKKKLKYGWRLVEVEGQCVNIDTSLPNRIIQKALEARLIDELLPYDAVLPEQKYSENSRIDFLLRGSAGDTYVEVKSVTMKRGRRAVFPDSVTTRGAKHLADLEQMVKSGHRAVMLYLVSRMDCDEFGLAGDIDPKYARAFDAAREAGVEVFCFDTRISPTDIALGKALPIDKSPQAT